jgi:hypothetical protein
MSSRSAFVASYSQPPRASSFRTPLQLAATPGHLDVNCYGSGTKQCSRAQIVSIAKPSMIRPYFDGSFLLEGQPSTRDATGKVFAVILWARAARS